jgi:hypothetical protein
MEYLGCAMLEASQWYLWRHVSLYQPDKYAIAEDIIKNYYRISFEGMTILAGKTRCMDCIVKDAIEILLHDNNLMEVMFSS